MVTSFIQGCFHQFMAGRLRAELPGADEQLIETIVRRNQTREQVPRTRPQTFRNPFRPGKLARDLRLELRRASAM